MKKKKRSITPKDEEQKAQTPASKAVSEVER